MQEVKNQKKINKNDPYYAGKYIELSPDETELAFPPCSGLISDFKENTEIFLAEVCKNNGCNNEIEITEEGNTPNAWYYLNNNSSKQYAGVTIERHWVYQNKWRKDTVRHRLYPGEHKEVFSMPRNQSPKCCITACKLED